MKRHWTVTQNDMQKKRSQSRQIYRQLLKPILLSQEFATSLFVISLI
jgi:hypothetical protein